MSRPSSGRRAHWPCVITRTCRRLGRSPSTSCPRYPFPVKAYSNFTRSCCFETMMLPARVFQDVLGFPELVVLEAPAEALFAVSHCRRRDQASLNEVEPLLAGGLAHMIEFSHESLIHYLKKNIMEHGSRRSKNRSWKKSQQKFQRRSMIVHILFAQFHIVSAQSLPSQSETKLRGEFHDVRTSHDTAGTRPVKKPSLQAFFNLDSLNCRFINENTGELESQISMSLVARQRDKQKSRRTVKP